VGREPHGGGHATPPTCFSGPATRCFIAPAPPTGFGHGQARSCSKGGIYVGDQDTTMECLRIHISNDQLRDQRSKADVLAPLLFILDPGHGLITNKITTTSRGDAAKCQVIAAGCQMC
jgi:hypothetical protein